MPATPPPDESLVAVLDRVADPEMDSRWDVSTKRTVLIIMLVGVCGIVWLAQPVLPMVLVGAIIAYLISPIVDLLQRVHVPRAVSTITIYLLVVVLLILTPVLVVPILIDQLQVLGNFDVQSTAVSLLGWFNDSVQQMPANVDILGFPVPLGETVRQFVDQLQVNSGQVNVLPSVADLLNGIQQFLSATTNVVGNTAVIGINVVGVTEGVRGAQGQHGARGLCTRIRPLLFQHGVDLRGGDIHNAVVISERLSREGFSEGNGTVAVRINFRSHATRVHQTKISWT